jgi:hypothetical protein
LNNENKDVVEIDYSIKALKRVKVNCCYENIIVDSNFNFSRDIRGYIIQGEIKNIAGKILKNVTIIINFLNEENDILFKKYIFIEDFENSSIENFKITINPKDPYFKEIDNIKFIVKEF